MSDFFPATLALCASYRHQVEYVRVHRDPSTAATGERKPTRFTAFQLRVKVGSDV